MNNTQFIPNGYTAVNYIDSNKALYKVYNDGSHFIGTRLLSQRRTKQSYKAPKSDLQRYFDEVHFLALQLNLKGVAKENFLADKLVDFFPSTEDRYEYIRKQLNRKWHNLHNRKKRFTRKAHLNQWNYFITITYNNAKMTADTFRSRLRRTLSNFHTRRSWRYMGVFENAPDTGRLHFHALVYVPDGQMVGDIELRKDYSTATHNIQETHSNTFFDRQYGRNDFEELNEMELKKGNTLDYLLKYIGKTNERIIYSRGIPTEITLNVKDEDIACPMQDYILKYVIFDNVIDWKKDIAKLKYVQDTFLVS